MLKRGICVHTRTVNTEEDMAFVLDEGVDAIITNDSGIALGVRNK